MSEGRPRRYPLLLSPALAARYCGVPESLVRRWVSEGLPALVIGGGEKKPRVRIPRRLLVRWLEERARVESEQRCARRRAQEQKPARKAKPVPGSVEADMAFLRGAGRATRATTTGRSGPGPPRGTASDD